LSCLCCPTASYTASQNTVARTSTVWLSHITDILPSVLSFQRTVLAACSPAPACTHKAVLVNTYPSVVQCVANVANRLEHSCCGLCACIAAVRPPQRPQHGSGAAFAPRLVLRRSLRRAQRARDPGAQAIAAWNRALAAEPSNAEVLLSMGVSYTNELDQGRALGFLRRWLERRLAQGGVRARARLRRSRKLSKMSGWL